MGSSLACSYICQLSAYSTSFSLQVSGCYFLRLVGLPLEAELLQWNREDPSWILLGQHVNGACWAIPIAADVWETGADHSFPDSALPWWNQHSCSDLLVHNCFTPKGSHTLSQQKLLFCLQTEPARHKCPYSCIFSEKLSVCIYSRTWLTSTGPMQLISHWAN